MSTITTTRLPDPDDDSIEPSLRRLESKLRWWSPLLLGWFKTLTPFTYTGAVGLSTTVGYILFLLPALVLSTIVTDLATGVTLFTTLTAISVGFTTVGSFLLANGLVTVLVISVLYTTLVVTYEPVEPNGTAVRAPFEWQRLQRALLVCSLVFIGSAITVFTTGYTTPALVTAGLATWWTTRRLTFTVIWDKTRYLAHPDYTEWLLASRLPLLVGVLLIAFNISTIIGLLLLTIPYFVSVAYFKWRAMQGSDNSQTLDDKRMHEKAGIPQDYIKDFSASGAYAAYGTERYFREAVRKFNSMLDTEIDTNRRVNLPESRLSTGQLIDAMSKAQNIHDDFRDVAYRPERLDDLLEQINKYGEKELEVIETEGNTNF